MRETIKNMIKKMVKFINYNCLNWYVKTMTRYQIKRKFLRRTDNKLTRQEINSILNYWKPYSKSIKLYWHRWYYSRNGIRDKRYIPEDIYYCFIEPFYNKIDFYRAYSDKGLYSIWFPEVKRPVTVTKNMNGVFYDDTFNIMSIEEVIERCLRVGRLVIKPSIESGGGRNISFINVNELLNNEKDLMDIINKYKKDFIIQELIEQHEELKKITPESVNTIRVMSFLYKGKVYILSSVLRMGINSSKVDNLAAGGISCGINKNGLLNKYAFDKYGNAFEKHPRGYVFHNKVIPGYEKILNIINREHVKFAHFPLISWDFAIDKFGDPVLIEFNLRFQEINFHQINNGPLFRELTDEVLEEVFGRR